MAYLLATLLGVAAISGASCRTIPTDPPAAPTTSAASPAAQAAILPSPTATTVPTATPPPPTPVPTATSAPAPTVAVSPTPQAVSGAEARRHVERLAGELGSRPVGSTAGDAAAAYFASQLGSLGYAVEEQRFPVTYYDDSGSQLAITGPRPATLAARAMRYSPAGEVTAVVVEAGLGRPADFAGKPVRGKIVLVQRGELTLREKADNAAAAGAAAVIVSNSEPGNFAGTLGQPGSIPTVSIAQEEGTQLRRLLSQGEVTAHLRVRPLTVDGTAHNVVATRPGRLPGVVVVGAHYDSVPAGPGGNDNASGVGVAIEVARVLAARDYPYTVVVVAFGAEEIGLFGSKHFVAQLSAEERQQIIAMVNLDMVGVGENLRLAGSEELVALAEKAAGRLGLSPARLTDARAQASDHASFIAAGAPALFITRTPDPNYHTPEDKAAFVQPQLLAEVGNLAVEVLGEIGARGGQ